MFVFVLAHTPLCILCRCIQVFDRSCLRSDCLALIHLSIFKFFVCLFCIYLFTYFDFFLQEKPAVPQPQSSNGNLGLPKSSTSNTVDTVDSSNHIKPKTSSCSNGSAGDQPDDYEKEERRRAAQRVLGKQG